MVFIVMRDGVVSACGAIAEIPYQVVVDEVDIGTEGEVFQYAFCDGVVWVDGCLVDGDGGGEVCSFRSGHISIASGIAKAIDVGVEAVGTAQLVNPMVDSFSVETVLVVALHGFKLAGWQ